MEKGSIAQSPDEREASGQDDLRAGLHGMWSAVAGAWDEHADFVDARGIAITERLLELSSPSPGERVLELACGPGGLGLAAARLVAPDGEAVLTDVAPEMTAIAAQRAEALGLDNVTTGVVDLEDITEPDASFDVVLCREGLMFAPDPGRGVREIARVLRPGGRVAVAVWGARERNPWLGLVLDGVSAELGHPVPPPGISGPFALSDPAELERHFADAGLDGIEVGEQEAAMTGDSFEGWWARTSALAGPLAKMLSMLPEDVRGRIVERVRESAAPYTDADGALEFPGMSLIASARRAG